MMLTKGDLVKVKQIVDESVEEGLEEKLGKLKSDFYDHIDPILKEVVASREEREITAAKLSEHTEEIETLKNIHPKGTHSFVSN